MADNVTPAVRSATMARVRSRDTQPELRVRRALHARGLRFRLGRRDLPGSPDIVLPRHRLVIFVHGCFWHSHPGCGRARLPSTNVEYWTAKLRRNAERDVLATGRLQELGWRVLTIWECETRRDDDLKSLLGTLLRKPLADEDG